MGKKINRRNFLRESTLITGGIAVGLGGNKIYHEASKYVENSRNLNKRLPKNGINRYRLGLIGAGSRSKQLLRYISNNGSVESLLDFQS